jgi:rSAM/selenodomain-associated transferase 1
VGPHFRFNPQQEGDLGARLEATFKGLFKQGAEKTIIVASDVPDISAVDIEQAFSALDKADMVIGPCTDGGYYLIGLKRLYPELFTGIDWSTNAVYRQTLIAANKLGLRIHSLHQLDDVDTEDDLRRWLAKSGLPENTTVLNLQREEA